MLMVLFQSATSLNASTARAPGLARQSCLKRKQTLGERKVVAMERKAYALEQLAASQYKHSSDSPFQGEDSD